MEGVLRGHSQLMSVRTFFRVEGGLEILKKRPDINYFSKSSENCERTFFRVGGEGVTRLSRAMTIFFSETLENLSRARAHYAT